MKFKTLLLFTAFSVWLFIGHLFVTQADYSLQSRCLPHDSHNNPLAAALLWPVYTVSAHLVAGGC